MTSPFRVVGAMAALTTLASEARAEEIKVTEQPGHTSRASITVDATPAQVYALVTDYANWRSFLGDIQSLKVESGGRRDAKVRFKSAIFKHEVTVVFDNEENRIIRFHGVKGPPGGRASGSYALTPVDHGTRTLVTATLYLDIVGVPGLFIGEGTIQPMRQAKLRADLSDVARWFAAHPASPSSSP